MKKRPSIPTVVWWLAIPLVLCAIAYPFLPDQIPRQFHADGTVSTMAREWVFALGLIPGAVYAYYKRKR